MALMQQSSQAALPLAMVMADRLEEMTPEMLVNIVSTPSVNVGPKSRLGLYAMVSRQKDAQLQRELIELLDTVYRERLIEMLDDPATESRFRPNLIESIADIGKLKSNQRGWQPIATPVDKEGKWRYFTFNSSSKMKLNWSQSFTSTDFMKAAVPPGMENWNTPEYDDSRWPLGKTPIGKGNYEGHMKKGGGMHRIDYRFPNHTAWNQDHEFLLMRATFDLDPAKLDYQLYRVGVLSAHCYKVFINGKQVAARSTNEIFPRYVGDHVSDWKALNLKPGRNTVAVITNHYLHRRAKDAQAQADVRLEGLDASELAAKQ
jgi:hypothetical protein